jgi:hypothetical protein
VLGADMVVEHIGAAEITQHRKATLRAGGADHA